MSRERRAYLPLEVDDVETQSTPTRSERQGRRKTFPFAKDAVCTRAFVYLRSWLPACLGANYLQTYEELEESYADLEYRYLSLLESSKKISEAAAETERAAAARINSLEQTLKEVEASLSEALQDNQQLRSERAATNTELETCSANLTRSEEERCRVTGELEATASRVRLLETEKQIAREDADNLGNHIQVLEQNIDVLDANLATEATKRAESELRLKESAAELASVIKQKEVVERRVAQIIAELAKEAEQKAATEQILKAKSDELTTVARQKADAERQLQEVSAQLAQAVEQSTTAETQIREIAAELATARGQGSEAERRSEKLQSDLAREAEGRSRTEVQLAGTAAKLSTVLEEKLTADRELERVVGELGKEAEQRDYAELQVGNLAAELAAERSRTAAVEFQLKAMASDLASAQQQKTYAEQQCEGMALELARLESETQDRLLQGEQLDINAVHQPEGNGLNDVELQLPRGTECTDAEESSPQNLWDSALDIPTGTTRTSTDGAGSRITESHGEKGMLNEQFREREEWQKLCANGEAGGWLVSPGQVHLGEIIGKGNFGTTHLGTLGSKQVAVKRVRITSEIEARTFVRELGALTRVRHQNIMSLIAAVVQPPQDCWLVVEYLSGGTLAEWLHGKNGRAVPKRTMKEKVVMGLQIAQGMEALHEATPPILHRDLKPANVLLKEDGTPKIADFGLCREHIEDEAYTYTGETGSYTYMSPEMMRGDMYGPQTDVYSFAIVMAEILKQRPPFEEFYLTPMQIAEGVAYNDMRPALPGGLPSGMKFLLEACWDPEPEARPSFEVVVSQLMSVVATVPARRGFFS